MTIEVCFNPGMDALSPIWFEAARRLGLPVRLGGDAYVHFDGETLHLATPEHLDADDSYAQLVLHELCHLLVEGPAARHVPDWGLDNTSDRHDLNERAAVRLQAHLTGAWGLRGTLYPTTVVRAYFEALGPDALGAPDDGAAPLARIAATRAAQAPFGPVLAEALAATAARVHPAGHPTGLPPGAPGLTCATCAWRTEGGMCRHAAPRRFVAPTTPACARHEAALDCLTCGACCRSAYDAVLLGPREAIRARHPALVVVKDGTAELRRAGDRCAALEGPEGGPWSCTVYADRPRTCRDFARGGRHCLTARRKVGLTA